MIRLSDWKAIALAFLVYFISVLAGVGLNLLVDHHGNMFFAPAFAALLAGGMYFILMDTVPRFGAISMLGLLMSLFFMRSGHAGYAFLPSLLAPLVADLIAYWGSYKDKIKTSLSYLVFSLATTGPIMFMWLTPSDYKEALLARGKNMAYIDRVMVPQELKYYLLFYGPIIVCALIGIFLGRKVAKEWVKRK